MALTRINLVAHGGTEGAYYVHLFKSIEDGSILRVEITFDEYMALREKGAGQPTPPDGYENYQSEGAHRFDTPSGRMEGDCFCDDGKIFYVYINGEYSTVPKEVMEKLLIVHGGVQDGDVEDKVDHYAVPLAFPKDGSDGFRITKQPTDQELVGEAQVDKNVVAAIADALEAEE